MPSARLRIDAPLQVSQSAEDVVEGSWLAQVHVAHCRVVVTKGSFSFFRRREPERVWPRKVVAGPRAAEESAFPCNDAVTQITLTDCGGSHAVVGKGYCICIV